MVPRQFDLTGHLVSHSLFRRGDTARPYKEPTRAYQGDAGYDLFSAVDTIVGPGQTVHVPTNTCADLPPGWFAFIAERSSQGRAGMLTLGNIVDEGYGGTITVFLLNTGKEAVIVHQGEKVGQLVLSPRYIDPAEHRLPVRGEKAYGSSGAR